MSGCSGSGGFSDVYLYEQDRPKRRVAVKVLLSGAEDRGRAPPLRVRGEPDGAAVHAPVHRHHLRGRRHRRRTVRTWPWSTARGPAWMARYRREPLRRGRGAAPSASRWPPPSRPRTGPASLHRDIKPANILVTDYDRPALTDFGISSTTDAADSDAGMSIPWSPPEAFRATPATAPAAMSGRLGATVYTLLAGRSPFLHAGRKQLAARTD